MGLLQVLCFCLLVCQMEASTANEVKKDWWTQLKEVSSMFGSTDMADGARIFGDSLDGLFGGGSDLGGVIAPLALLLASLALLSALIGPLIAMAVNNNNNLNTNTLNTNTNTGTLPVIAAAGRKRRALMKDGLESAQVLQLLSALDEAFVSYDSLENKSRNKLGCDVFKQGPITSGSHNITKQFISSFTLVKELNTTSVEQNFDDNVGQLFTSVFERC